MSKARLENAFGEFGINGTIQKVEPIRNIDGSIEYKIACYHPRTECNDRKTEEIGSIAISRYCPHMKCKIRKD